MSDWLPDFCEFNAHKIREPGSKLEQMPAGLLQGMLCEEELETIEHLLCTCPALGTAFFESLNSVSRVDIKALHRLIRNFGWLRGAMPSLLLSRSSLFYCVQFPHIPFYSISFSILLKGRFYNGSIRFRGTVLVHVF